MTQNFTFIDRHETGKITRKRCSQNIVRKLSMNSPQPFVRDILVNWKGCYLIIVHLVCNKKIVLQCVFVYTVGPSQSIVSYCCHTNHRGCILQLIHWTLEYKLVWSTKFSKLPGLICVKSIRSLGNFPIDFQEGNPDLHAFCIRQKFTRKFLFIIQANAKK